MSLLDDVNAVDIVTECRDAIERITVTLQETQYLHTNVEEECVPYLPVAVHCTKLFEIVQRVSVLCPLYFWPFDRFMALFTEVIRKQTFGKGSTGNKKLQETKKFCLSNSRVSAIKL